MFSAVLPHRRVSVEKEIVEKGSIQENSVGPSSVALFCVRVMGAAEGSASRKSARPRS
jgi:hypothetical protein